jgi:hypothetical protein
MSVIGVNKTSGIQADHMSDGVMDGAGWQLEPGQDTNTLVFDSSM